MNYSTAGRETARATVQRVSVRAAIAAAVPWLVAIAAGGAGLGLGTSTAEAKTPGKTYCFVGRCHRVRTIEETRRAIGKRMVVRASFYGDAGKDRFNPSNITSSGEYYRSDLPDNAASPIWPDGTLLLVWNPANKRTVVVRINNAGPYWGQRTLDLSRAAALRLGFAHVGVATLQTKVLAAPTRSEATYRRGRTYPPAPGFLGIFQSIDTALVEAGRALGKALSPPAQAQSSTQVAAAEQAGAGQAKIAKTAAKKVAKPRAERAKVKTAARRAVASAEAGAAKKRRATRVARAETPVTSGKAQARTAATRTAQPVSRRAKRANRGGDQPAQRRSQAVAEVKQVDEAEFASRNARRRAPAARAVAAVRRNAKPAAAPSSVVANSESDALKYQYRPSRCYGWPSFCGREEG